MLERPGRLPADAAQPLQLIAAEARVGEDPAQLGALARRVLVAQVVEGAEHLEGVVEEGLELAVRRASAHVPGRPPDDPCLRHLPEGDADRLRKVQ